VSNLEFDQILSVWCLKVKYLRCQSWNCFEWQLCEARCMVWQWVGIQVNFNLALFYFLDLWLIYVASFDWRGSRDRLLELCAFCSLLDRTYLLCIHNSHVIHLSLVNLQHSCGRLDLLHCICFFLKLQHDGGVAVYFRRAGLEVLFLCLCLTTRLNQNKTKRKLWAL
jgi:hypothetical protein